MDEDTFHEQFVAQMKAQREAEQKAVQERQEAARKAAEEAAAAAAAKESEKSDVGVGRLYEDDEGLYDGDEWKAKKSALEELAEKMAKKDLKRVDHSKIDYMPFRKKFYIQARDITNLTAEEVRQQPCPPPTRVPTPLSPLCALAPLLTHR